ncbi:hypothetical protein HPE56_07445 [Maribacter sp. ANRC-HE7]|uniref:Uncharacterized protein n=1 Tax=Maribacter aquimaris TaxID=2737171 RepID=A0ABR7UZD1_9FLAO|nr:hypothetical protein [Maribacter aquimaris]MBD0777622.1 hypothetical protein [Maribacter aquimaris]
MKKIHKRKTLLLLSMGLFIIATSQIISQYVALDDLAKGSLVGIGIGLLLTSLIFGNFRSAQ